MTDLGASVSLSTVRNFVFAGARQLAVGMAAAAVTFSIGNAKKSR